MLKLLADVKKLGYDRRGNSIYVKDNEGKEITEEVRIDNEVLHNKVIDTDLPEVIRQYKEFSDKLATGKVYYDAEEAVYRVL